MVNRGRKETGVPRSTLLLYDLLKETNIKDLNYAAVADQYGITTEAARMRYIRLKSKIIAERKAAAAARATAEVMMGSSSDGVGGGGGSEETKPTDAESGVAEDADDDNEEEEGMKEKRRVRVGLPKKKGGLQSVMMEPLDIVRDKKEIYARDLPEGEGEGGE
ncbi:MAG: hypothetical protein M1834_005213 [Cirrosporium novae-zelandiae]|nr:MAG: hypothetical protein M1834_005213 [Cirrosporium novae-zelandiae]